MKAIITHQYGGVEVLQPQDVDRPVIEDDEILVQIRACAVNPIDWKVRKGDFKILTGRKPPRILGNDYAGIVVEVGSRTTGFEPGDAVWGFVESFKRGTYAEFVKVTQDEIGPKPENLNFEEAAALPTVGLTAYQALVYRGHLKAGQHVLVNGCSGGVGLAAVQIVKALGGIVTGVCSARNRPLARDLGVDHVIDYSKQDVLACEACYDIFFDVVANKSFTLARGTLKPAGIYIRTLPSFEAILLAPWINLFSAKKARMLDCKASQADLAALKTMIEQGQMTPLIEKTYPLDQVQTAHVHSEAGHVVGKLVLKL